MRRILLAMMSAATFFTATAAFAAYSEGLIKSIDAKKKEVVLDNGQTYFFSKSNYLQKMKVGEKVKIHYQMKNGKNEATEISPST